MDRDRITRTGARAPGYSGVSCSNGGAQARHVSPAQYGESNGGSGEHEGRTQTERRDELASEMLALKPERGKPAFRNFREGHGNGGIIRSPLRAIALPDYRNMQPCATVKPFAMRWLRAESSACQGEFHRFRQDFDRIGLPESMRKSVYS
jgi:hypothetical protein